jgi:hypothetical protein
VAATPLPGRTTQTASRVSLGRAQLPMRWDRVSVLVALVAVLTLVLAATVVVAVRDDVRAPEVKPAPIEAADQMVDIPQKCPPPTSGIIHTAPPIRAEAGAPPRTVSLTFDDGPGAATPQVLDVLQRAGVHATFFVIGQDAAANPEMLRRIIAGGHALGDHTWVAPHPESGSRLEPRQADPGD